MTHDEVLVQLLALLLLRPLKTVHLYLISNAKGYIDQVNMSDVRVASRDMIVRTV